MKIPDEYVEKLRARGLYIPAPWSPKHVLADGIQIYKRTEAGGNKIPGFKGGFMASIDPDELIASDAPGVSLFWHDERWVMHVNKPLSALGLDDIYSEWTTIDDAVNDVLDFFFGDPQRMDLFVKNEVAIRERLARYSEESK